MLSFCYNRLECLIFTMVSQTYYHNCPLEKNFKLFLLLFDIANLIVNKTKSHLTIYCALIVEVFPERGDITYKRNQVLSTQILLELKGLFFLKLISR